MLFLFSTSSSFFSTTQRPKATAKNPQLITRTTTKAEGKMQATTTTTRLWAYRLPLPMQTLLQKAGLDGRKHQERRKGGGRWALRVMHSSAALCVSQPCAWSVSVMLDIRTRRGLKFKATDGGGVVFRNRQPVSFYWYMLSTVRFG